MVVLQRPIQLCKVAAVGLKCEVAEIPHQYLTRRQKRRVDAKNLNIVPFRARSKVRGHAKGSNRWSACIMTDVSSVANQEVISTNFSNEWHTEEYW